MPEMLGRCAESTLSDRYQTTIPEPIRKALGLSKRDKIGYTILDNKQVVISRIQEEEEDPVVEKFLSFLAKDIEENPQRVTGIDPDLLRYVQSIASQVDIDLDAPLADEDE